MSVGSVVLCFALIGSKCAVVGSLISLSLSDVSFLFSAYYLISRKGRCGETFLSLLYFFLRFFSACAFFL